MKTKILGVMVPLSTHSSSSNTGDTRRLLGSLEQSLLGKRIVNELLEEDNQLSFWEGIGRYSDLPDFTAHSYIKPGDVRKVKRMNMQIYRMKLLSETESVANFFVPLRDGVESYFASVLKDE